MGELYLSSIDFLQPHLVLADSLDMGEITIREEGNIFFLSSKEGEGYIPVLSFHKLGDDDDFELNPDLFEELITYLQANDFHVISDKQYLQEDYTYAITGKKLIVLGSDDGSSGTFYYKTIGDVKTGQFIMENGDYIISESSMVSILNKYLPRENGKGNFTFYITFDAIPFRQTGGGINPGPPYNSMFAVLSKLKYLQENYYIGNHTANHLYSEELDELDFLDELILFYDIMKNYGIDIEHINTLAYSFGIGDLQSLREQTVNAFNYHDITLLGAFDYDGYFSRPLCHSNVNPFDVSRIGVDNKSFGKIMTLLKNVDIFKSKRVVLLNGDEYPFNLAAMDLNYDDLNYILIRN